MKSGVIQFHNDKITIGSKNQDLMHLIGHTEMKAFGIEPESLYKRNIQYIKENSDLSIKKFNQLENQLNAIVSKYPSDILGSLRDEFESDIKPNNQPLREAIRLKVKRELDIKIETNDINVNTTLVKNDLFKHESNLKDLLTIDKNTEYHILDSALFSIGGLHEKILQMEYCNCLSGFKPDEISIFKAKLKFIEQVIELLK